jgi:hypothetical protein
MVNKTGFRFQVSGVRDWLVALLLLATATWHPAPAFGQQPQTSTAPVFSASAKYVQGVGPGFWPTTGSGLTLNLTAGTAMCNAAPAFYAGGTLTLAASETNYVYLDPDAGCVPASNTTGFRSGQVPIAQVTTDASSITNITDLRGWFVSRTGPTLLATDFPGADAGTKIGNCLAALPAVGGTCDARGLEGEQTIGALTIDKPARLLLGGANFNLTGAISITSYGVDILGILGGTLLDVDFSPPSGALVLTNTTMVHLEGFTLQRKETFLGAIPELIYGNHASQLRFSNLRLSGGDTQEILLDNCWNNAIDNSIFYGTGDHSAIGIKLEGSSSSTTTFSAQGNEFNDYSYGVWASNAFGVRILHNVFVNNTRAFKMTGGNGGTFADNWVESGGVAGTFAVEVDPSSVTKFSYQSNRLGGTPASGAIVNVGGATISTDDDFFLKGNLALGPPGWQGGYKFQALGISGGTAAPFSAPSDFVVTAQDANTDVASRGADIVLSGGQGSLGQSKGIVIANNLYAEEARDGDVVLTGINDSTSGNGSYIETAAPDTGHYGLVVVTGASSSALYVRADGRVGIGTPSPSQQLDVNGAVSSALDTVSFSTTPTFDASLGNTQKITLTGNVTSSTLSNASAGEQIHFFVCQDASGGHTFAWPSNVKGGMTVGSTASSCSAQSFIFDGTNAYALSPGVTNM